MKGDSTVLGIFIAFVVIAVLLILFLTIVLVRNVYFKKSKAYIVDLRITLQRDHTKNKDSIQKCAILAKNEKKFEPICDSLKNTNLDIGKKKDVILQNIGNLQSVIDERRFFQVAKVRKSLKKLYASYKEKCNTFDHIAEEFNIDWKLIDDVFTNYLEIVDYYKDVLNKNKIITSNTNAILMDKVQKMAKRLSELDNSKYKGEFSVADKKIDDLRIRLNDLNNLIVSASKIEYYIFECLPEYLSKAIKKETNDKLQVHYKKLNDLLDVLSQKWYTYDTEKLAQQIKLIYNGYWTIYSATILSGKIEKFNECVKKDLARLLGSRQKLYLEVSKSTTKLNKAFNNVMSKVEVINTNKNISFSVKYVNDYLKALKEFDSAYLNYKLETYHINGMKLQREQDLAIAVETYFSVVENEHLTQNEKVIQAKNELKSQFESNIKRYKTWAKHETIWDSFIHNLSLLVKDIAINEKYHEMYDAICLEVASNEKFLINSEKVNAYKELINQTRIQIQQNNNYKESYQAVKRFLIKERYVQ
ncbi:hypothetical protein ACX1NB_01685 [Mycoplasma sp. HF14]